MTALEVVGALAALVGTGLVFHMILSLDRATSPEAISAPEPASQERTQHRHAA